MIDDSDADRRLICELLQRQSGWKIEQAKNGAVAMARMSDVAPDIVVTDLMMPVMNGLELVKELRIRYPEVPVILMTAYGTEDLAVEALDAGAASYVPKARVAFKLLDTMEEVLRLARAERDYERLIHCLTRTEFTFSLENDPGLIDPLVELAQQMVVGIGLCDFTDRLRIGVAFREALLNSVFHGSLEITLEEMQEVRDRLAQGRSLNLLGERQSQPPYCDRTVFVDVKLSLEEARFVVRDEGPGFDTATIPDPSKLGALEPDHGRGLPLMRTFMDEVIFNESGNEVTMIKRRRRREELDQEDSES